MTNAPGPNDKWALDDGSYSPRNFYTTSTDGNGHSETAYAKISPFMRASISQIIQQRTIPEYSTIGAVIRDSIAHRLKQIAVEFGDVKIDYLSNQILMYEHQVARAERRNSEERMVAQIIENIRRAEDDHEEVLNEVRIVIASGMLHSQRLIDQLRTFL